MAVKSLLLLGLILFASIPEAAATDSPAGGEDPATLLQDCRTMAPAESGVHLSNRSAKIGHMAIEFEDGVLFPLKTNAGAEMGFFFRGQAYYSYSSADPGDQETMAINLGRHANAPPHQGTMVHDRFRTLLLFSTSPVFPELYAPPAAGASAGPEAAAPVVETLKEPDRSEFRRMWNRILFTYLPWDHRSVQARANGFSSPYVMADFDGDVQTVGYAYDAVWDLEEEFFLYTNVPQYDVRIRDPLSRQPVGPGWATPIADLALQDVQLNVTTEDNRKGRILADLTFRAERDGLRAVSLSLINNRSRYTFDWSSSRNQLRVVRITDESGQPLPFSHKYHEILVLLPRVYSRTETIPLHFEAEGEILTGLLGDFYDNYFGLPLDSCFPRSLGWSETGYTFGLTARTRKPYLPVASGAAIRVQEDGEFYKLTAASEHPVGVLALFGGKYELREQKFDDTLIRAYAYSSAKKNVLERMPGIAHQFLRFLETVLGDYPFKELNLVEIPEIVPDGAASAFGIAAPGMVLLTSEAYRARTGFAALYFSVGVNERLAHEIAHQWFGYVAVPASVRDYWLAESFAEYLAGLAMAASQPDERQVMGFSRMLADWQSSARLCADSGSLRTANFLGGDSGWTDRFCLLYKRGPLVLHMLHTLAGQERFSKILRRFLEMARGGRRVTTEDFRKAAEEVLAVDMGWFFEDWVDRGGIPTVTVRHQVAAVGAEGFVLSGRVSQPPGSGFRRIMIPLVLDYAPNRREVRLVFQDRPEVDFRFVLSSPPRTVQVDPSHNNLAVYR